jgi:ABC-type lipoprotein export system ATPase subunit
VLADEPTGSLDRKNSRQILSLMRTINQQEGTTFLIVTHEPELAAQASQVLHMEDGRILSPGDAAAPSVTKAVTEAATTTATTTTAAAEG